MGLNKAVKRARFLLKDDCCEDCSRCTIWGVEKIRFLKERMGCSLMGKESSGGRSEGEVSGDSRPATRSMIQLTWT